MKIELIKRSKDDAANQEAWKDLFGRLKKATAQVSEVMQIRRNIS